jgi:hypothetical protein
MILPSRNRLASPKKCRRIEGSFELQMLSVLSVTLGTTTCGCADSILKLCCRQPCMPIHIYIYIYRLGVLIMILIQILFDCIANFELNQVSIPISILISIDSNLDPNFILILILIWA